MKRVKKPVFFVVALLILALVVTSLFGVYGQHGDFKVTYIKGAGDIRWGIDIRGGVEATFSPADGVEATTEQLEAAKEIIETRMVSQSIDPTNNRIIVRFPWRSDEQDYDPEAAIDELAATAQLTFRQGMEYETSEYAEDGSIVYRTPSGTTAENIILEGSDVVTAEPRMTQDETTGEYQYVVALTLSDEGAQKFAQATTAMVGETISIWMDDVMLSAPTVKQAITNGECVITGDFTSEEATQLAARIQAGALPFALQVSSFSSMPPTLGAQALDAMLLAGIIAFVVISLLMIVIFRLPGVVAVISLAGQVGLCMAAISGYFPFLNSYTMTLPGLAGIVLSIGMGVDANVISASRIREELFSFGFTLLVGIIGNFIMGMTATRLMTLSLAGFKGLHKKWLFGGARGDE